MTRIVHTLLVGAVLAVAVSVLPSEASAANCNFNRNEKIAMVSWIIPLAGAVITPLACKRDLFNKKNSGAAVQPEIWEARREPTYADRRRRRAI